MTPRPVIIDCDPGIDDALALILALTSPDALDVLAITTVAGNKPLAKTTANALRVLDLLPPPRPPVHAGSAVPLDGAALPELDFHGRDGLGDIGLPAPATSAEPRDGVEALIETVMARPAGSVTLCAVGPLTTVAQAFERAPGLAARLDRLLIMGGNLGEARSPEFNFRSDPLAARRVLSSGADIALFGLNVTMQADVADPLRVALEASGGAVTAVVRRLLASLATRTQSLHDAYVIASLLEPALFESRPMPVTVAVDGPEPAGTCLDGGAPVTVMTGVDKPALLDLLVRRFSDLPA